jgi:hypothetical protein
MSRRRPKGELQFGSDSFLDVVANIVGILIILIVIAGLRVGQTPVVLAPAAQLASSEIIPIPAESGPPDLPDLPLPVSEPAMAPQVIVLQPPEETLEEPEPAPPPLPALVAPRELVAMTGELEAEIAAIRDAESKLAAQLRQSGEQKSLLVERQKAFNGLMSQRAQELDASRRQVAADEADLELARATLTRLLRQVKALESEPKRIETLEHKITPISRVVHGGEKHYRLEKNRVIEVPVDELVGRLKEQIERRKDWLVKTRQHQGQIGPLRGFSMQYLVRVETLAGLDEAKTGHGGYRISLANWEIQPEPETRGETDDVALRKGSQFYQSILGAQADTTLTFWVYPDSYAIYRKLQKFTHDHGFSVAGRPLPPGTHISGSPNGSKSASQ